MYNNNNNHSASVTAETVHSWILQSSTGASWQATQLLNEWRHRPVQETAPVLLHFLSSSEQTVVFYSLSTMARLVLPAEYSHQLRTLLLQLPASQQASSWLSAPHLRNKAALILSQQLVLSWDPTTAAQQLIQTTNILLFLKTLETFFLEDFPLEGTDVRQTVRTIKHVWKENRLMEPLVERILSILDQSLQNDDQDTAKLALETIAALLQWTNLNSCVAHDLLARIVHTLFQALQTGGPVLQQEALKAWKAWALSSAALLDEDNPTVSPSENDLLRNYQVMNSLLETLHQSNLLPYDETPETDEQEIEVVIAAAQLIDSMGQLILPQFLQAETLSLQLKQQVSTLMYEIIDLFFRAFAYDDIDVSGAVLGFAAEWTRSCLQEHSPQTQGWLSQSLNTLYNQLKYPPEFQRDFENEVDAEEEVYRENLCKLYVSIVRVAPTTTLMFLREAAESPQDSLPHREATIRLLYHYCDGIRPPPGLKVVMKNETFCSLVSIVLRSDVVQVCCCSGADGNGPQQTATLLLYYDFAVRYSNIFKKKDHQMLLSKLLQDMTGSNGLQHVNARVRSRCCYLLQKLISKVVSLMRPFVGEVITGIQGLIFSNRSLVDPQFRLEDTLYLFETMGLLLGKSGIEAPEQERCLSALLSPQALSVEEIMRLPNLQPDVDTYGPILSVSIAAMAHLSKGFVKPSEGIQNIFLEMVRITCSVLERLPQCDDIRNKSVVLLQRMVSCVGPPVLSYLPRCFQLLTEYATTEDDVLFVSQMLNQLCTRSAAGTAFHEEAIPVMDAALVPFLQKVRSMVQDMAVSAQNSQIPPHLQTEQLSVQKLAFVVLQQIVASKGTRLLLSNTNANHLEGILRMVSEGAIYVTGEPSIRKTCLKFFRDLSEQWLPDGAVDPTVKRGLVTFVSESMVPGVLQSMMEKSFDEKDAMNVRCIAELGQILFSLYSQGNAREPLQRLLPSQVSDLLSSASAGSDFEKSLLSFIVATKRGQ